jgi:DNA gyrase subunit A
MAEISIYSRITSGVRMIHLDEDVTVAKIAKVREKVSNGDQEFDNIEDAMEDIPDEKESEMMDSEEEAEEYFDETEVSDEDDSEKNDPEGNSTEE